MDSAFLAAISALAVSLLGASAQLWQVRVQHRLARQQAANSQALEFSRDAFRAHREALKNICTALQRFQDELMLLNKSDPGNFLKQSERGQLISARDEFLRTYREHHTALDEYERQVLLEARDRCVDLVLMLDLGNSWDGTHFLTYEQKTALTRVGTQLGDYHQRLLFSGLQRLQKAVEVG